MLAEAFIEALQYFARPEFLLMVFAGVVIGLVFGIIPGLSSIVAGSLLLPLIFGMRPEQALPLLMAVFSVTFTGGSITAILLNVPGTPTNVATLLDGYPMTQKGEGSRALGAALMSSGTGGILTVFFALAMIPLVLPLVRAIGSAELVFLILMGITFIAVLGRGSMLKGLMAGGAGLILSFIGLHRITGALRFTLGTTHLVSGLAVIPVALGLYALPEMIALATRGGTIVQREAPVVTGQAVIDGAKDVFRHWGLWLRSCIIGYVIGVIPGVGAPTATFVTYGQAKQISKHSEKFGTGIVEGVIAPESANNAKESGALLTTLALGIPGSAEMALLLAALLLLGERPGPEMLTIHLSLSLSLILVIAMANVLGTAICFMFASRLAKVATIPAKLLVPTVLVLVFIGAFAYEEQLADIGVLLTFGLLGLAMRRYDFSRPALFLGYILGDLFEKYLFIAYAVDGPLFFLTPISMSIIFVIIALSVFGPLKNLITRRLQRGTR